MYISKTLTLDELNNIIYDHGQIKPKYIENLRHIKYFYDSDLDKYLEPDNIFITLFDDDDLIGLIKLQYSGENNIFWLQYFSINPEYQGFKLSKLMINELISFCKKHDISIEMSGYTKLGFERIKNQLAKEFKNNNLTLIDINHDKPEYEKKVYEWADSLFSKKDNKDYALFDKNVYPFWFDKKYNFHIGEESSTHTYSIGNIIEEENPNLNDDELDELIKNTILSYPIVGRLWLDANAVSFWKKPTIDDLNLAIENLNLVKNIDITDDWFIDYFDKMEETQYIKTIDDFRNNRPVEGVHISNDDYEAKQLSHLLSPINKKNKKVFPGWGSEKIKSDKNNLAWKQALNRSEAVDALNSTFDLYSAAGDKNTYPIWTYENIATIGEESIIHSINFIDLYYDKFVELYSDDIENFDELNNEEQYDALYKFSGNFKISYTDNRGRLFYNYKTISFYNKPSKEIIKQFITAIESKFKIKINTDEWFIQINNNDNNIILTDYLNNNINEDVDCVNIAKDNEYWYYDSGAYPLWSYKGKFYIGNMKETHYSSIYNEVFNKKSISIYNILKDLTLKFKIDYKKLKELYNKNINIEHYLNFNKQLVSVDLNSDINNEYIAAEFSETNLNDGRLFLNENIIAFYASKNVITEKNILSYIKLIKKELNVDILLDIKNWKIQFENDDINFNLSDILSKNEKLNVINEYCDELSFDLPDGETIHLNYDDNDARAYLYYKNKIYFSKLSETHTDILKSLNYNLDLNLTYNDLKNYGRIWCNNKVISIGNKTIDKNEIKNVINDIKTNINITIDDSWYIEFNDNHKMFFITIKDFFNNNYGENYKKITDAEIEEQKKKHLLSPIDKINLNIKNTGWGSEKTKYDKHNLEWKQALNKNESVDQYNKSYHYSHKTYPIWIYKNTCYIGEEGTTHRYSILNDLFDEIVDMSYDEIPNIDNLNKNEILDIISDDFYDDFKEYHIHTEGRIFYNDKCISFYAENVANSILNIIISAIENKFKIKLNLLEWKIELDNGNVEFTLYDYIHNVNESVDCYDLFDNYPIWYYDKSTYPMWICHNEVVIGRESTTHDINFLDLYYNIFIELYSEDIENFDDLDNEEQIDKLSKYIDDFKETNILYISRLFLNKKTISFYDEPYEFIYEFIKAIESKFKLKINNDKWFIQINNSNDTMTINEYLSLIESIKESVDTIMDKSLLDDDDYTDDDAIISTWSDDNVYPIWTYGDDNIPEIGEETTTHDYSFGLTYSSENTDVTDDEIDEFMKKHPDCVYHNGEIYKCKNEGRLFLDDHIISFYNNPGINIVKKFITEIKNVFIFEKINLNDWFIQIDDSDDNIPLNEYLGLTESIIESVDSIYDNDMFDENDVTKYYDMHVYPIWTYDNNIPEIGEESTTHNYSFALTYSNENPNATEEEIDLFASTNKNCVYHNGEIYKCKNLGRFFRDKQILSFYNHPSISIINKFIELFKIKFRTKANLVKYIQVENEDENIPLNEYLGLTESIMEHVDFCQGREFYDDGVYPIWLYDNKIYIGEESTTHQYSIFKFNFKNKQSNIDNSNTELRQIINNLITGRLFIPEKTIAIYNNSELNKNLILKFITEIEKHFGFIVDDTWKIEIDHFMSDKKYEVSIFKKTDFITESVDGIGTDEGISFLDINAYPLWYFNNTVFIGDESSTHNFSIHKYNIDKDEKLKELYSDDFLKFMKDYKLYRGRLFINNKLISVYYDDNINEIIPKYIEAIKNKFKIKFDSEWIIEIDNFYLKKENTKFKLLDYIKNNHLNEFIDTVIDDNNVEYTLIDKNTYPFWFYKDEFFIGQERGTHLSSIYDEIEKLNPGLDEDDLDELYDDYKFYKHDAGRLFIDPKIISFYYKPDKETLKNILTGIKNKLNLDILSEIDDWYLELDNEYFPLSDFI
jgi:GNAT superfamily N-acetyltransferase